MFRKMPFILAGVILAVILINPFLPLVIKQVIYAVALTIKSVIITLLPVIIFCLLFKATVNLAESASKIVILILLLVCISSFIALFFSYFIGEFVYNFDLNLEQPPFEQELKPYWSFSLPLLLENKYALLMAIISGIVITKLNPSIANTFSVFLDKLVTNILNYIIKLIPVFVAGFTVKLAADGIIKVILNDYAKIFILIALVQFTYISFTYFIFSQRKNFLLSLKNMVPAVISAFSTMSSAASMPLTIMGAQNNCKNKNLAASVIPATVNIHLVGDSFATPIFAFAILKTYGVHDPSIIGYLMFSIYFVIAKFSVAAIPGGGIIVMLPILETYLGFSPEMLSLITALYILFDPVITSANVLGNGAFSMMMDKLMSFLRFKKS